MTAERDDRRKLNRDAAGAQPPAPVERPTTPEQLPSRSWTEVKTEKWLVDLTNRPNVVVARALWQAVLDESGDDEPPFTPWSELNDYVRDYYTKLADAALDALSPLLPESHWRPYVARRDQQIARLETALQQFMSTVDELETERLRLEALLQRYRESVRKLVVIVQRKRAGANRQVEYYKRQWRIAQELLRRRQS